MVTGGAYGDRSVKLLLYDVTNVLFSEFSLIYQCWGENHMVDTNIAIQQYNIVRTTMIHDWTQSTIFEGCGDYVMVATIMDFFG